MFSIAQDTPEVRELLMGNEAIARGALEAGVRFCAAYPGTPSSEIPGELARVAKEMGIYVEWSTNEKVAAEVAAAASYAGLRALTTMKNEGLSVALDFLSHLNLLTIGGEGGALVVVVCDDPDGISSPSEVDVRWIARSLDILLLEPDGIQEAKDMTKWAFDLSEEFKIYVMLRSVTRISHASGNVMLGELPEPKGEAHFDTSQSFRGMPVLPKHFLLHRKLAEAQELFESSPFNSYTGPEHPEVLIVCCGSGRLHSLEAIECLDLEERVGVLKLGTTWPLPRRLIEGHLARTSQVLVVEEVDPFLETSLKELTYESPGATGSPTIYGKASGHIEACGELSPEAVIKALCQIFNLKYQARDPDYDQKALEAAEKMVVNRALIFCAGCPHRASFWSIKNAFKLDGRDGFVTGDIGCYAMEGRPEGFQQSKTVISMGSSAGLASGFGKLEQFGFDQPVIAVCGDSTFYHAAIPALVNAVYNKSNLSLVVLDNSATAMTGFQPHPGTGSSATGETAPVVDIEALCRSLGCKVEVSDAYDLKETEEKVLRLIEDGGGVRVLVLRRKCALVRMREEGTLFKVWVDAQRCLGEACGCARFCTRAFKCPGLVWDEEAGKARVEEAVCNGCGVCVDICPEEAIVREAKS